MNWSDLAISLAFLATAFYIVHNVHVAGPQFRQSWDYRFVTRAGSIVVIVGIFFLVGRFVCSPDRPVSLYTFAFALSNTATATTLCLTTCLLLYGSKLTHRLGRVWVKALDFPYLLLGLFGLVRLINSIAATDNIPNSAIDTLTLFALALALAFRLSKSIIEVFFDDWY